MKRFLLRTMLFALPVFLAAGFTEYSIRQIPNDYSYKNDYLNAHAEEIEVLILGSSHTFYGIDPAYLTQNAFNAAHVSQTLDYDYYIYSKFRDRLVHLKTVVVPISYFTFFTMLRDDVEYWRAKNYALYYGCKRPYSPQYHLELCNDRFLKLFQQAVRVWTQPDTATQITVSPLGYGLDFSQDDKGMLELSGINAAQRHTYDSFKHLDENIGWLNTLISECASQNAEVFLFTPPAWHTYRDHLDPRQLQAMKDAVAAIAAQHPNVRYRSFFDDERFVAEDFVNADHLNADGARKLTQIINAAITPAKPSDSIVKEGL